ncbi:MAG: hypothetical protein MHM6MM_004293 [Cercozoa sp. M6MM]
MEVEFEYSSSDMFVDVRDILGSQESMRLCGSVHYMWTVDSELAPSLRKGNIAGVRRSHTVSDAESRPIVSCAPGSESLVDARSSEVSMSGLILRNCNLLIGDGSNTSVSLRNLEGELRVHVEVSGQHAEVNVDVIESHLSAALHVTGVQHVALSHSSFLKSVALTVWDHVTLDTVIVDDLSVRGTVHRVDQLHETSFWHSDGVVREMLGLLEYHETKSRGHHEPQKLTAQTVTNHSFEATKLRAHTQLELPRSAVVSCFVASSSIGSLRVNNIALDGHQVSVKQELSISGHSFVELHGAALPRHCARTTPMSEHTPRVLLRDVLFFDDPSFSRLVPHGEITEVLRRFVDAVTCGDENERVAPDSDCRAETLRDSLLRRHLSVSSDTVHQLGRNKDLIDHLASIFLQHVKCETALSHAADNVVCHEGESDEMRAGDHGAVTCRHSFKPLRAFCAIDATAHQFQIVDSVRHGGVQFVHWEHFKNTHHGKRIASKIDALLLEYVEADGSCESREISMDQVTVNLQQHLRDEHHASSFADFVDLHLPSTQARVPVRSLLEASSIKQVDLSDACVDDEHHLMQDCQQKDMSVHNSVRTVLMHHQDELWSVATSLSTLRPAVTVLRTNECHLPELSTPVTGDCFRVEANNECTLKCPRGRFLLKRRGAHVHTQEEERLLQQRRKQVRQETVLFEDALSARARELGLLEDDLDDAHIEDLTSHIPEAFLSHLQLADFDDEFLDHVPLLCQHGRFYHRYDGSAYQLDRPVTLNELRDFRCLTREELAAAASSSDIDADADAESPPLGANVDLDSESVT